MHFTASEADIVYRILRWRRDVRHFKPDAVDDAVLARLCGAMDCAPSVGNSRPWRVIEVVSASLRAGVRASFIQCNGQAAADYAGDQQKEYLRLKLAGLDAAPVQLAVFTLVDPQAGHGLGRRTMPETVRQSTAMAVYAMWLAARAENIGLGMVSILDPNAMKRLFMMPEGWEFSAYLCLGHPAFDDDTPLLHREGWQENSATIWEKR